jgi:hypothetical protein
VAAPALAISETANIIRRHELARLVGADQAAPAHATCWTMRSSTEHVDTA